MGRYDNIDYYAVMQHMPRITGMDLRWNNGAWEGMYYITGIPHPFKRDKLKVKLWNNGIWLHEQGGESMSLQNWLQRYGGAADWREAMSIMRGESTPDARLLDFVRSGSHRGEAKHVGKEEYKACALFDLRRCPLFVWMAGLFGEERVRDVWSIYHVTTDGEGMAVFWYTNADGLICYDKRMRYKCDGHRDKAFGGTRKFVTAKGYTERPLFGAHLIKGGKSVNVVESEKTALIASLRYPDHVWVSTGGKNNLSSIRGDVMLYPDMDASEYWSGRGFDVCEWWVGHNVGPKEDIGDLIIREILNSDEPKK